jgi:hypothetical protein
MIAANPGQHIANDAERRDHCDPVRGFRSACRQHRSQCNNATKHQTSPIMGAKRRKERVATSEMPNSKPAANTITGPEGRLP